MNIYTRNEKIVTVPIEDEMRLSYMDYAMSVIVSRALPDVRDGLKPVQRRILVAMNDLNLSPGRPFRKCAKIAGDVSGNYHPHGEQVVYPTLVRLAQEFSLRYPLVSGQGNFGSIDGDPPAAMRYTEARLSAVSMEMLRDMDKDTVNFRLNYDETLSEPSVLPASFPNLLVNGSAGIAVGMATSIPPHNLGEVVDALVTLIDNPEAGTRELLHCIKGPDFPTGGVIMGKEGIVSAYHTGRGAVKTRGRAHIERKAKPSEKDRIVITEIPYQVNKRTLVENIADLVRDKKITGVSDLRDESDKDGIRVVLEIKKDEQPDVVLNHLYNKTQLQSSMGIILLALVRGRPMVLNLKEILYQYLQHRKEVVTRRTKFELAKAEARAHILEGLKIALDSIDAVIETIRNSKTVDVARERLVGKFGLTDIQAQAILDMRLQRLTGLEREKVESEYVELLKTIARLQQILSSEVQLMGIIKQELLEIRKKYADERRTDIVDSAVDITTEDLIAEEEMVVTISHTGYIKRIPVSTYRRQNRGGRGVIGGGRKDEDFIRHLFIASTHAYIIFFTDRGRCYWRKGYELPEGGRLARGKAIPNLLNVEPGERITAFKHVMDFTVEGSLLMITERGIVKKTPLAAYSRPRAGGIIAINLDNNDRLIDVEFTNGDSELLLATRKGKAIRFHENDLRQMGRVARGVKGISLQKDDKVVGATLAQKDATVLTVTANGYGKRSRFSDYRLQKRGGQGIINMRVGERNGPIVGFKTVSEDDDLMIITAMGIVIRIPVNQVRVSSRNVQGVRFIRLAENDRVVAVAEVAVKEEEEQENVEAI